MLKAVIFDFDGVIADAEPVHMRAFQEVLYQEGLSLSRDEYYDKYLALDDKTFFATFLKDKNMISDQEIIASLMERKSEYFNRFIRESVTVFPGVKEFIANLSEIYSLAIGSGALRKEIEFILNYAGIRDKFNVITSAEDVTNCKPDPEVFFTALDMINGSSPYNEKIYPHECLVIEDSIHGVQAAHSAGMKCLAVTNSYPPEKLSQADMIVSSLEGIKTEDLEKLF